MTSTGKCPKCGYRSDESLDECPNCGIVFKKWKAYQSNFFTGTDKKHPNKFVVGKEILRQCEKSIKERLGSLNDLPNEFANTVVNIYYQYHLIGGDGIADYQSFISLEGCPANKNPFEYMAEKATHYEETHTLYDAINETIDRLRKENIQELYPRQFQKVVEVLVDMAKYRIKNADVKPRIIRKIERRLRKKYVNEIPNLINMINVGV